MRVDKYLSNIGIASRKDIAYFFKQGLIYINGNMCLKGDFKLKNNDEIEIDGKKIIYKENIYMILNKPVNYVSSNKDESSYLSYKHLISDTYYIEIVEIVGRLDVDTTGLLLLTNNGKLIHKLIHPKKDIFKKYYVKAKEILSEDDIKKLESGVKIDDFITKPALVKRLSENEIELSISEGKFHQIKKMLLSINNEVVKLHRLSIGEIQLGDLEIGKYRFLNQNEINYLEKF
ncbi:rRNA pseudouridine synthase [Candidatus Gracilibacteria bacterium]|nr:rRNA pseudouridine synthase [Candidatus Gracilibacteria bacterium]